MADTKIEWTDRSWNPVTGCTKISPGCDHCYAERMAPRLAGRFGYPQEDPFAVTLHPDKLKEPRHWRKPSKVFVCSMSDLFHPSVPFDYVKAVFFEMWIADKHTFQVLTKRPGRMAYFANHILPKAFHSEMAWPPNVWAGTSVESARYLPRLDVLARVPAKVRFVSAEPLLGPLDLRPWLAPICPSCSMAHLGPCDAVRPLLVSWVIAGGESGPGARPMHSQWPRDIRDQCREAGVPFFFKQWGEWCPTVPDPPAYLPLGLHSSRVQWFPDTGDGGLATFRVGKKAAGALLDGREWREFPVA